MSYYGVHAPSRRDSEHVSKRRRIPNDFVAVNAMPDWQNEPTILRNLARYQAIQFPLRPTLPEKVRTEYDNAKFRLS